MLTIVQENYQDKSIILGVTKNLLSVIRLASLKNIFALDVRYTKKEEVDLGIFTSIPANYKCINKMCPTEC